MASATSCRNQTFIIMGNKNTISMICFQFERKKSNQPKIGPNFRFCIYGLGFESRRTNYFWKLQIRVPGKKKCWGVFCPVQTLPIDRHDEVDGSHFWVNILTFRRTPPSVNVFEAFFESLERQRERKKPKNLIWPNFRSRNGSCRGRSLIEN